MTRSLTKTSHVADHMSHYGPQIYINNVEILYLSQKCKRLDLLEAFKIKLNSHKAPLINQQLNILNSPLLDIPLNLHQYPCISTWSYILCSTLSISLSIMLQLPSYLYPLLFCPIIPYITRIPTLPLNYFLFFLNLSCDFISSTPSTFHPPSNPTQPFLHKSNDFFTSMNCTFENELTVRNISSFYNKVFIFCGTLHTEPSNFIKLLYIHSIPTQVGSAPIWGWKNFLWCDLGLPTAPVRCPLLD
jgi:hypothetical protein